MAFRKKVLSKFRNQPTTVDGFRFDSKKEAIRWGELKLLLRAGQISELKRQVGYPLHGPRGSKITTYVADFVYFEGTNKIVEDVKGGNATKTPMYKLKKKWMADEYGIEIRET